VHWKKRGFLSYEDELIDQDIFLYDFYFSKIPIVQKKIDFSLNNDIALETSYSDQNLAERISKVPDNFHFDEFFFDNLLLFLCLSFFFFPFVLFELTFLLFFFFYTATFLLLDEDNDEDPFTFLEEESDISHYNHSEFHFVDFFSFNELFFYSGF
jgi:hypothetical protein